MRLVARKYDDRVELSVMPFVTINHQTVPIDENVIIPLEHNSYMAMTTINYNKELFADYYTSNKFNIPVTEDSNKIRKHLLREFIKMQKHIVDKYPKSAENIDGTQHIFIRNGRAWSSYGAVSEIHKFVVFPENDMIIGSLAAGATPSEAIKIYFSSTNRYTNKTPLTFISYTDGRLHSNALEILGEST
jgi:hypothetical protein